MTDTESWVLVGITIVCTKIDDGFYADDVRASILRNKK
jgi:hypothetical protein